MRMRVSHATAALLGAQSAFSTPIRTRATDANAPRVANDTVETSDILPGAYIVEFADENDTPSAFYESLAADGVQVEPRMDLSFRFFNGVSFQVRNSSSNSSVPGGWQFLRRMQATPRVRSIWPARTTRLDVRDGPRVPDAAISTAPNARVKYQTQTERTFSPHVMTQIDRLHAEGVTGKGFRIAIVDSGVDYTHPALGGCFGPGCLVEVGYDFTGDNFLPGVRPAEPDDDPMDDCVGHGTHIAGTIAAQLVNNEYGFVGAAPGAKLAAYRTWGCTSTSTVEIELAAFARAVEDGADIISYSNGDSSGWAQDARAVVLSRIVDSGIPVVVSEGNDGGLGLFYASTPATGYSVTGTGAVSNTLFPALLQHGSYTTDSNSTNTNTTTDFGFLMGVPAFAADVTLPLWSAVGVNNACEPLPDNTPDLSQRVVLLEFPDSRATQCYPQDQGANIAAKGGRFLMYYERSNLTMRDEPYVYADGIQGVARAIPYQAKHWLSLLEQGSTITVTIPNANATQVRLEELENNISGGYVAGQLTSWGPSWELSMTPQLVSPGENILSTYPTAMGSYRVMTGTSMATPLVSGVYALLGEVYGKLDPKRLRRILTSTSKPLAWHDGRTAHPDILAPVPQQGAGIVQVWHAVHTTAELSVDSLSFNDTDHFAGNQTFSVQNTGSTDAVFELGHRKAVTMYTMRPGLDVPRADFFPNPIVEEWADIQFSSKKITVPAGGSTNITVTCTPPTNLNATLLPVYSGYITLGSASPHNTLVVPYLGVAGSMRSTPVLQPSQVYLADFNMPAPANRSYVIPRPDPENPSRTDRGDQSTTPNVYINPTVGTRVLRVDVLHGEEVLGSLAGWPQIHVTRGEVRAWFNGLLVDGTVVDEGWYSFRIMALRIFGNEEREGDWDVVRTVEFSFTYKA
ncbi:subtilisin-like protein [Zopfia rhizophila CBS 207.26]|uniref:Subtilisin-like protein n=1 Tax=Zopfia rhizophila CBS 207.26 TaxID=1314779 RepID=A0A6A6DFY6_9PEZI|nr:subtilisin-like protein [Zopfia rhizophila CBS 207.26]